MKSDYLYLNYKDVWKCFNPSGRTEVMQVTIIKRLKNLGVDFELDYFGNIFVGNFNLQRPCLVSHMDSVHSKKPKKINLHKNILKADNGIGADDKAGIVAILEILKTHNVNAIFTVDEEIGGIGASNINSNKLENVLYFIEIDRAGSGDVIDVSGINKIASKEMINKFIPFMTKYNYKCNTGTFTDVNILTKTSNKSAVNLSCGYYNAHTTKEFIRLDELENCINFVKDLLSNIKEEFIWEGELQNYYTGYNRDDLDLGDIYSLVETVVTIDDMYELIDKAYELGLSEAGKYSFKY